MPAGSVLRQLVAAPLAAWVVVALATAATPARAAFTDVSMAASVNFPDHTYGLAWGDLDRDEDPDLLVVRHFYRPVVYRNLGTGSFSPVFFPSLFDPSDHHGPLLADFDDDGDLDIYLTSGADAGTGTVPKKLYRNDGEFEFTDIAAAAGLADGQARGRSSSAMDVDGDGALDLFVAKAPRVVSPNSLFLNDGTGHFTDIAAAAGVDDDFGSVGCVWGDFDGDRDPDFLIGGEEGGGSHETRLYRNEGDLTFTNVAPQALPGLGNITSADWGDYDKDGDLDLAVGLGDEALFDAVVWGPDSVRFFFNARGTDNGLDGFAFTQTGDSSNYNLFTNGFYQPATITYSREELHPGPVSPFWLPFAIHGAPSFLPGQSVGIYAWTDSLFGLWQMRCNTPPAEGNTFAGIIKGNGDLTFVGTTETEPYTHGPRGTRIYRNDGGVFAEVAASLGVVDTVNVRQVGWADVDLDGALDLFVLNKGDTRVMNQPDVFYRNLGDGTFTDATAAQGLAGATNGLADAFSFDDYDLDGDLDLAVVNGSGPRFFSIGTIHRLYRNDGSNGNALRVDLEGVFSTRDGYGSWVTCVSPTAGRQVRYVTGNSWRGGSTMIDPVFGLGEDAAADTLKVVWPSGALTILTDVPAGKVVIVETDPVTSAPDLGELPASRLRVRPHPNPSAGEVTFALDGRGAGPAFVDVYDAGGRLVARRAVAEGERSAAWNGFTREGEAAAPGVYFARAREGTRTSFAKFVLLRR